MDIIQEWFERKLSGKWYRLKEPARASHKYVRPTGARTLFGKLTLSAEPADRFSFNFQAHTEKWQRFDQEMEPHVLNGILDIALCYSEMPILGVSFTLEEIEYHPVDSSGIAYYICAREAAREIFGLNGEKNISYPFESQE